MRPLTGPCLFGAELSDGAEPVFHVEGFDDSAVLDGLNIDRYDPKALAGVRHAEQVAGRRTGDLATDDDPIARDQHFLDVEFHVRNGVREVRDHLDRRLAAPAFPWQIAGAGLVALRQDLLLDGFDVAPARDIEQAVPGRDGGAGLFFGEAAHGFFLKVDARSGRRRATRGREARTTLRLNFVCRSLYIL